MPRTRTEFAKRVMVRLTQEDLDTLHSVIGPGEKPPHCYLRLAREAVVPADTELRYRKPPLFDEWMVQGPLSPLAAVNRGERLMAAGFEVVAEQVVLFKIGSHGPVGDAHLGDEE